MGCKIAVTVVAYNAADTIAAAMESIVTQDYDDFQVIFYDDASTDGTPDIVRSFCSRCNLIMNVAREHCGKAEAHAHAFSLCNSEYVIACDADDEFRPGALKMLVAEAVATGADMVMAPMIMVRNGKKKLMKLNRNINSLDDMAIDTVHFSLCNKLLRTETVKRSCMPIGGIDRWEDLGVIARFMSTDPVIARIDTPVYNYIRHSGRSSLTKSPKEEVLADRLAMTQQLLDWVNANGLSEKNAGFIQLLKFHARIKLARNPGRDIRKWASTFPEINRFTMSMRHLSLPVRIICTAMLAVAHIGQRLEN